MTQEQRVEERSVMVDGATVHLRVAGEGRPLLLLHGLLGSGQTWRRNIDALAQDARVYAIDLFNMGKSERVLGLDASLEGTADRLVALMDVLGLDKADVAAHSHGGAIAMMMAARYPDRVGKLILFAPANPFCSAGYSRVKFFQTKFGVWLGRRIPWMPRAVHKEALRRMYGDPNRIEKGTLEYYTEDLQLPGTMEHVLAIVAGWFDDMNRLRRVLTKVAAKPVLLVWGDRDRAVSLPSAHALHRLLKRSKLMVIEGAGHLPFEELPETCNQAMRDWLMAR